jgi:FAD-dependent urate hydroxylase
MQTWRNMPPGMSLKAYGFACSIATPDGQLTLPAYCRDQDLEDSEPIEIATFSEYGLSVQQRLVPHAEPTNVSRLEQRDGGFSLTLETGETFPARRVVVAVGLSNFEYVPSEFGSVPAEFYSHTAAHSSFGQFAGRNVTVLGAGQSALQAAALLQQAGADVTLLARGEISWGWRTDPSVKRTLIDRMRVPNSSLGGGRDNWLLQHLPMALHYAPEKRRLAFTAEHLGPSGAWWLRDSVEGKVRTRTGVSILNATPVGSKLSLRIAERGEAERDFVTDHVVSGTGYVIDIDKLPFLDGTLAGGLARTGGSPRLSRHFESSVEGLYFVGPVSAASFGPLFRFIAGAPYTTRVVARHVAWASKSAAPLWQRAFGSL